MTTQLAPDRLGLPPPLAMDLVDAGRTAGWIAGETVGFRGFTNETEAAHAAWVAHRTLARRLARTHNVRSVPVDIEPLAIQQVEGKSVIAASGKPIAELIRPGSDSRSGVDSFGFELSLPAPITDLETRAIAYLIYRTLRKSGVRWGMWRPEAPKRTEASTVEARKAPTVAVSTRSDARGLTTAGPAAVLLAAAAVVTLGAAPFVTVPLTAVLVLAAGMGVGGAMLFRRRRLR